MSILLPVEAAPAPVVTHYRTFYRPKSVYIGSEAFSGGASAPGSVARLGPSPIMRLPIDRWSDIETAPGVYNWTPSSLARIADVHRAGAEALAPVRIAASVPAFYPASLSNATTRAAAQAFAAAYAAHGYSLGGSFIVVVDPRVQETVFTALPANPDDWASLFVLVAAAVRTAGPGMKVLPDIVGDGHSSYLPGGWLTTAMSAADVLGIEESAPLVSTILSDLDWFIGGPAAGRKIWIVGSAFSTYTGADSRAHGTEADQAAYFNSLLTNVIVGYSNNVEAVIQTSLADLGAASVWEYHLGVTTTGMAADKPAVGNLRGFMDSYPPYHPVFQQDLSDFVASESYIGVNYFSPTDFEYLDWSGVIDFSQATAVNVDVGVSAPDAYPGYLVRAGSTWRMVSGPVIDIKPFIAHGDVNLRFIFPGAVFNRTVTIVHLRVTPVIDTNMPDVFPPRIESSSVTKRMTLNFTDDLDPVSSLEKLNYQIRDMLGQPLTVLQVETAGPKSVILYTAHQKAVTYRLIVSGVKDESGNIMTGAATDTVLFQGVEVTHAGPIVYQPILVDARPFGPGGAFEVQIQFGDDADRSVDLEIFDVRGRLVRTLAQGATARRGATWTWNADGDSGGRVAAGIYFVRARSGDQSAQARLVVSR